MHLFQRWKVPLRHVFKRFAGANSTVKTGARELSFDEMKLARRNLQTHTWLRLCRDYKFTPGQLRQTAAAALFHRCNLRRGAATSRPFLSYNEVRQNAPLASQHTRVLTTVCPLVCVMSPVCGLPARDCSELVCAAQGSAKAETVIGHSDAS